MQKKGGNSGTFENCNQEIRISLQSLVAASSSWGELFVPAVAIKIKLFQAEETSDSVVFVTERVVVTLSTLLASQGGGGDGSQGDCSLSICCSVTCIPPQA